MGCVFEGGRKKKRFEAVAAFAQDLASTRCCLHQHGQPVIRFLVAAKIGPPRCSRWYDATIEGR